MMSACSGSATGAEGNMAETILISDGAATNRITMKVRLAAACYITIQASNAPETLVLARSQQPKLILLDADLPDTGGPAVCRALKADPATRHIPVICLCPQDLKIAALRAGADEVLPKPLDEAMLLARIRGFLRDGSESAVFPAEGEFAMCDTATPFATAQTKDADIALIAPSPAIGVAWKHALAPCLGCLPRIIEPDQALAQVMIGRIPDLYLIAAELNAGNDGLRLLSELRARPGSRDAGFVVAVAKDERDIATIALDLGAGDVLPVSLCGRQVAEEAALRIANQIQRKHRADHRRNEAERNRLWAMTDPLTGMANRRYATRRLEQIAMHAELSGTGFVLMALDLDRFKQINDTFGHAAGDSVLAEVGLRLRGVTDENDLVARMGGEEFLIAMPDISPDEAYRHAERIRSVIEEMPVMLPGTAGAGFVHVTASIGLAFGNERPNSGRQIQIESLIAQADHALMRAKAGGRNRVALGACNPAA